MRVRTYLVAIATAFAVAAIGGWLTDLGSWYQNLIQPDWKPPDSWFGPVWTTLFLLIGISAAMAWEASKTRAERTQVLTAFAVNAVLNLGWSYLFFTAKQPSWALVEVVFLWLSIILMIVVAGRRRRLAGWLLVPYMVWVGFAATVNFGVTTLN